MHSITGGQSWHRHLAEFSILLSFSFMHFLEFLFPSSWDRTGRAVGDHKEASAGHSGQQNRDAMQWRLRLAETSGRKDSPE